MARRPADRPAGNLAVLGAASPAGAQVKAALADRGVPGDRVELFGHDSEVAVLSEYDGEARLVQPASRLDPSAHVGVFVCEPGYDPAALLAASRAGTLIVDLIGALPEAPLAGTPDARGPARLVAVPHPVSIMLASLLEPLQQGLGLARVSAFVLRPASDFGEGGLEELREQTVRLLRFESTPTALFGRQLAFNVIPGHLAPDEEDAAAERIIRECGALLGSTSLPVAISLAVAPIFYGHGIAAHVDLFRGGRDEALALLRSAPGVRVADGDDAGTVLDAPEGAGVSVARIDGAPGTALRIWALGSEAGASAASAAVRLGHEAGVL